MHSIQLDIEDNVFDKVIYFLQNLPKNEVRISKHALQTDTSSFKKGEKDDLLAYSNHSANLIEEWKESSEDDVWKYP